MSIWKEQKKPKKPKNQKNPSRTEVLNLDFKENRFYEHPKLYVKFMTVHFSEENAVIIIHQIINWRVQGHTQKKTRTITLERY